MADFQEIVSLLRIDQDTASKIAVLLKEANGLKPEPKNISQIAALFREKLGIDENYSLSLAVSAQEQDVKNELRRKIEMKLKEAALLLAKANPSLNRFSALKEIFQCFKKGSSVADLSGIEENIQYPRDIDLGLFEPDMYKGTENYFACSYVPHYSKHRI